MFYKNCICLIVGIIIGVRLTDIWDYVKWQNVDESASRGSTKVDVIKSTRSSELWPINVSEWQRNLSYTLADRLYAETRVLCWIMTTPANHLKRALNVRQTWGRRCHKLLFMSDEEDGYLPTIKLEVGKGRKFLWHKTLAAFRHIYDHYFDEADWFLKADDDTYFIMENLREFLYQFSTEAPVYFGCKFHPYVDQGYMSGGAGYVLSKEALRRLIEVAYANTTLCPQSNGSPAEDRFLGTCLQNVGVIAGDSRDADGQERFIPLAPRHLIPVDTSDWYSRYLFYKRDEHIPCCSSRAISFHYIKPKEFHQLEYFIYHLRPFGLTNANEEKLPTKFDMKKQLQLWSQTYSNNLF